MVDGLSEIVKIKGMAMVFGESDWVKYAHASRFFIVPRVKLVYYMAKLSIIDRNMRIIISCFKISRTSVTKIYPLLRGIINNPKRYL
jgi:hypothetical protein